MKPKLTPAAESPADLARQATAQSAAAMREGRFADARQLATLADQYGRLAGKTADPDLPIDLAAEEVLRQKLLIRLHAHANTICEQEGWPRMPELDSPDLEAETRRHAAIVDEIERAKSSESAAAPATVRHVCRTGK
ncbi:hypothetical protein GCM10009422_12760 [Brevundimonas kwangchunensis]|uniref:Uncharacterized protein n=1 Tax=Brevundimonas kwangchunensis TaxID=322163 RepID=A0ABP3S0N2_9CAUL